MTKNKYYLGWNSNLRANHIVKKQRVHLSKSFSRTFFQHFKFFQQVLIPELHSELGMVFKRENKINYKRYF